MQQWCKSAKEDMFEGQNSNQLQEKNENHKKGTNSDSNAMATKLQKSTCCDYHRKIRNYHRKIIIEKIIIERLEM